jgi:tetratricopeptide (TPR) repeat protein
MRFGRFLFVCSALLGAAICEAPLYGQPPLSSRQQLKQYVADLQKNPSDDTLREKIIKLALTLDPKPGVPDDAVVAAAKGDTIFAHAAESGSKDDLKASADAFVQASLLAPWVAAYYLEEGAALEKAGQFDAAIRALNFYLIAAPKASDASDVRGKIEGIKYERDSAVRQAQQEAQAAQERERQILANLSGTWRRRTGDNEHYYDLWSFSMTSPGSLRMRRTSTHYGDGPQGDPSSNSIELVGTIAGHQIHGTYQQSMTLPFQMCGTNHPDEEGQWTGSISEDGRAIAVDLTVQSLKLDSCTRIQENQHFTFKKDD